MPLHVWPPRLTCTREFLYITSFPSIHTLDMIHPRSIDLGGVLSSRDLILRGCPRHLDHIDPMWQWLCDTMDHDRTYCDSLGGATSGLIIFDRFSFDSSNSVVWCCIVQCQLINELYHVNILRSTIWYATLIGLFYSFLGINQLIN